MRTAASLLILLFLIAGSSTSQIRFNKFVIGKSGERVPGLCVSDIDLDGDPDIIGCNRLERY
jgi:hypothetical protein